MNTIRPAQAYTLHGTLFLPSKQAMLSGRFTHDGSSALEGEMSQADDARDQIQGILLNTEAFCIPGPSRNLLLFAHYSRTLPNKMFYLQKEERGVPGMYTGVLSADRAVSHGVDPRKLVDLTRYMDMVLKEDGTIPVRIMLEQV